MKVLGMGADTHGCRICKASSQSRKSTLQSTVCSRASCFPNILPAETNEPQAQKTGTVNQYRPVINTKVAS